GSVARRVRSASHLGVLRADAGGARHLRPRGPHLPGFLSRPPAPPPCRSVRRAARRYRASLAGGDRFPDALPGALLPWLARRIVEKVPGGAPLAAAGHAAPGVLRPGVGRP